MAVQWFYNNNSGDLGSIAHSSNNNTTEFQMNSVMSKLTFELVSAIIRSFKRHPYPMNISQNSVQFAQ